MSINHTKLKDLDGKTLKILVNKMEDVTIVIGLDIESNKQYILEETETE